MSDTTPEAVIPADGVRRQVPLSQVFYFALPTVGAGYMFCLVTLYMICLLYTSDAADE